MHLILSLRSYLKHLTDLFVCVAKVTTSFTYFNTRFITVHTYSTMLLRTIYMVVLGFIVSPLSASMLRDSFILVKSIQAKPRAVTDDDLGNIYILNTANTLEKYDSTGRLVTQYTNQRLGRATYIDATNPMRPLLWYQDFQTIVFLDRNLTEMGMLRLSEIGFQQVACIGISSDGNIWIYDSNTFKLSKLTPDGKPLFESPSMNQLESPPSNPDALIECNDRVVLSDHQKRVWIFDLFAQPDRIQVTTAPVANGRIINNQLVYIHEDKFIVERIGAFKPAIWALPTTGQWYNGRHKIMLLNPDQVNIYQFKQ